MAKSKETNMAKGKETKRTKIKNLPVEEKELTKAEASKVKGGTLASSVQKKDSDTGSGIIGKI